MMVLTGHRSVSPFSFRASPFVHHLRALAITDIPFCQMNRDFLILKNFAPLLLCARKHLNRMNGLAVMQPL